MPRTKLLILFSIFALPLLASYLSYYFWQPAGRKNYGELIPQVGLKDGSDQTGRLIPALEFKGKWTLVYLGNGACDRNCATLLYYMRQVRIAQGPEQDRINRMWVVTDGVEPAPSLLDQHNGLKVVMRRDPLFLAQFAGAEAGNRVYIVDPLGNLMMRFPVNPDPSRMIKDIKLLLKASQIG